MSELTEQIRATCDSIAENQKKVYDLGFEQGKNLGGYSKGFEAGKKSQYDELWDTFLNNGARGSFSNFFRESGFEYIRPNRKIIVTGSISSMFHTCQKLKKIESQYFDFSQVPRGEAGYSFCSCTNLEEIEDVGLQTMATYDCTYAWSPKLKTIAKIRVDENTKFYTPFANLFELQHLIVEGVIGQNNFDVRWSTKLSKASWISIMTAASTTANITITGSLVSVNKAFETSPGANDGSTSPEWLALKAARPTVSVSLV